MDPEYKNEPFVNFKIKNSVAQKYRRFTKQMEGSQSSVLDRMIDFFERHKLSPDDQISNHLIQTEKKLLKRINAVIAIIKDIEKKQTLPTVGMLQALFEAELNQEEESEALIEKNRKPLTLEEELRRFQDSL